MPSRFDKFDKLSKTSLGVYGSAPLANIIYNMDAFNVTDTNTRTVDNVGSLKSTADGDMDGSNFIELGAGQSVTYSDGTYKYIFRVSTKEFETIATNVIDFNHGQYFTATSQLSASDITTLNANPNLIYNVWFDSYVLPSGFAKADMVNFYPAGEGVVAVEKIYDISDVLLLTFVSIVNYTASCRTALANQNYGATNHLVKQDATGRAIALADDYLIEHNGDGRYIDTKQLIGAGTDFTIHQVFYATDAAESYCYLGADVFGETELLILKNGTADYRVYVGSTVRLIGIQVVENSLNMVSFSYNKTTRNVDIVVNNTQASSITATSFLGTASTLYIGNRNNVAGFSAKSQIGKTVIDYKLQAVADMQDAYAAAKLKYPTLP